MCVLQSPYCTHNERHAFVSPLYIYIYVCVYVCVSGELRFFFFSIQRAFDLGPSDPKPRCGTQLDGRVAQLLSLPVSLNLPVKPVFVVV